MTIQEKSNLVLDALGGSRGFDQQRIAQAGIMIISTLLKKNADYGSSAWTRPLLAQTVPPQDAILVRMSDKVARITGLQNGRKPEVEESLIDTVADLVGYGILWLSCPDEEDQQSNSSASSKSAK